MKTAYKVIIISLIILLIMAGIVYMAKINQEKNANPIVVIETSKGNIEIELYPDKAPVTVENFLSYADEGFYDGTVFHRVIAGFMIQGGGFTPNGNEKDTHDAIVLESQNGLKNELGTIAMARTNVPDSATSQFFINAQNNVFLNYASGNPGYAVFGKVISGLEIVRTIEKVDTTTKFKMEDWPEEDVIINRVYVKK